MTAEEVLGELPRIFRAMDQPTVDGVNTYFVARTAREAGLTVALSGLGGDELFGGYPAFAGVPRLTRAVRIARMVPGGPRLVRAGLRAHPRGLRWVKAADALDHPPCPARAYLACRGVFAPSQVRALLEPELWEAAGDALALSGWIAEAAGARDPVANGRAGGRDPDWFSWVARAELATYTRNQLLRDTDVMGMAHSLEIRVPLLDHPLVETVLRLPAAAHRDGAGAKPLLRRAVGDLLPATVLARRAKQGFVFPVRALAPRAPGGGVPGVARGPRGPAPEGAGARGPARVADGPPPLVAPLGARRALGVAAGELTGMLAVIETHPIQYHAPVYRALATRFGVPVTAIYGSDCSVVGYRDREFGTTVAWDTDLLSGYTARFLSRVADGGARTPERVSARGLGRALAEVAPRAVLLVGYSPGFHRAAFLTAWRAGLPILFRGETTDHAVRRGAVKTRVRDRALRWLYGRCARLLYVGRRSYEHFRRLGCPEERLLFSPYCVDTAPFEGDEATRTRVRDDVRRRLGLAPEKILLLFSGKLSSRKGPEILIRAVGETPPALRDRLDLAFLGDGELRAVLEGLARRLSVRAHFIGFRGQTELSPLYHAADLLVLPSLHSETWGLVVNEALHHGLPCVVSDAVGCWPDLVEPGVTGEVCETGSPHALATALERALPLIGRAEVRARCREKVAGYTVERAAEGIARAYEAIMERGCIPGCGQSLTRSRPPAASSLGDGQVLGLFPAFEVGNGGRAGERARRLGRPPAGFPEPRAVRGFQFGAAQRARVREQWPRVCLRANEARRAVATALSRRWGAQVVLVWHLALLRLLPFLRVPRARVVQVLHGIEAWRAQDWLTRRLLGRVDLFLSDSDHTWERFLQHNPGLHRASHRTLRLGLDEPVEGHVPPPADPGERADDRPAPPERGLQGASRGDRGLAPRAEAGARRRALIAGEGDLTPRSGGRGPAPGARRPDPVPRTDLRGREAGPPRAVPLPRDAEPRGGLRPRVPRGHAGRPPVSERRPGCWARAGGPARGGAGCRPGRRACPRRGDRPAAGAWLRVGPLVGPGPAALRGAVHRTGTSGGAWSGRWRRSFVPLANPIRVLHVIPSVGPLRGGPSVTMRLMARGLARAGCEVHVATTDDDGPGRLEVPLGVPVVDEGVTYRHFRRQTRFYGFSWPLTRWLARHVRDYDLVHAHALFSYATLPAAHYARRPACPTSSGPSAP